MSKPAIPVSPYPGSNFVPGEGKIPCDIMFIGEAPGESENMYGRPFCGSAGRVLQQLLTRFAGLKRSNLHITNAVKFRPPNNNKPDFDVIQQSREFLLAEITAVNPKIIILLGKTALEAYLNKSLTHESLNDYREKVLTHQVSENKKAAVIVTYHPAVLLRGSEYFPRIKRDFMRIREILNNPNQEQKNDEPNTTTPAKSDPLQNPQRNSTNKNNRNG